jgi:hypothetical protein
MVNFIEEEAHLSHSEPFTPAITLSRDDIHRFVFAGFTIALPLGVDRIPPYVRDVFEGVANHSSFLPATVPQADELFWILAFAVQRFPALVIFNSLGHDIAYAPEPVPQTIERTRAVVQYWDGVRIQRFALALLDGVAREPFIYRFGKITVTEAIIDLVRKMVGLSTDEIRERIRKAQEMVVRQPYQVAQARHLGERIIVMMGLWNAKMALEQNQTVDAQTNTTV